MPNKQIRLKDEEISLIKAVREKQVDVIDLIVKINSLNEIKPQKNKVKSNVIKWNIPNAIDEKEVLKRKENKNEKTKENCKRKMAERNFSRTCYVWENRFAYRKKT